MEAQVGSEELRTKRKMKTPLQLQLLENAYAAEKYPSESVRAELSVQLDLSDRQLQMWFCHRRLKERKLTPGRKRQRKDSDSEAVPTMLALHLIEARAIAFMQSQLGEPLREDGPMLGLEFDSLPLGAFAASNIGVIAVGQQKLSGWPYDTNIFPQSDAKPTKGASRTLREYQFLPEKPTVSADMYESAAPTYHYSSPTESPHAMTPLSAGYSFIQSNEQEPALYGLKSQMLGKRTSQQSRVDHLLPSTSEDYDNVHRKNFTNITVDAQFGAHPITQLDKTLIPFDRTGAHDEALLQIERKHKSEEARIMREVEAHEKRIRKELEKQDIMRRKREEQIRKDMERLDRERRKEEERLLREKQREEERYLREQRREMERKEKFLQKESIRAEKMRQKEEMRREKEAMRLKASNERALARKFAKESMELIEDECLELMELAASSKGLPSMLSLDYETLHNLDSFVDMRTTFPPKSVGLKKPFGIPPWIDSEENVGNLLMVWRFLITFVDVLGLWPFTLDEFLQAFHDYDSRLLAEIHVSLLRSIIKDIEDVARTPCMGLGANHNYALNPEGGHPEIVEGAYAWGFDIKSWQCNLNPLTWPEILRQFAVSAGFGPQLKKRGSEAAYLREDNEGSDVKDIISNLRSGAAVQNAFSVMQEKGFSNPRKSRHCLTPGTVKFAAFHVLSLEGSKGLSILEVVDRVQKSGLRDLTTSKTPEASVAAALSRDSKLFERTAPSTYCVRVPYRKDPVDAEAVLSGARERIQTFKSGILNVEEAVEAEKDEESESDAAEIDNLVTEINREIRVHSSLEARELGERSLENSKGSYEVRENSEGDHNVTEEMPSMHSEAFIKVKDATFSLDHSVDAAGCISVANLDQEDTDFDDRNPGEPWVQGLTEGEYSDLSVEERLSALVALISVAVEGKSIRIVIEERLEAASSLKKQMWAVAQLDKRRLKEHVMKIHDSPFIGNKTEQILTIPSPEDSQSLFLSVDEKKNETTVKPSIQQEWMIDPQNDQNHINKFPCVGNLQMKEYPVGSDYHPFQQPGFLAEKSHKELKSYIGHKAEEMYAYRSLPLGEDRRHNRYWQFTTSASRYDPGCGRIFIEMHDGCWRLIDSEEGFDGLLASLDVRGHRESHLQTMLQKIEILFKEAVRRNLLDSNLGRHMTDTATIEPIKMPSGINCSIGMDSPRSSVCAADCDMVESSTTFSVELGKNETEKTGAFNRYQDLERWIWKECVVSSILRGNKTGKLLDGCDYCHSIFYFGENHCHSCHKTFGKGDIDFPEHVVLCQEKVKMGSDCILRGTASPSPIRIKLLKLILAWTEVSIPVGAIHPLWTNMNRKSWGRRLHSSASAEDLLQVLASLESAIEIGHLSSNFETTSELLDSANGKGCIASNSSSSDRVAVLPWIPLTTAAVALRLMEFNAAICYTLQHVLETEKGCGDFSKLPERYKVLKRAQNEVVLETAHQAEDFKGGHRENLHDRTHGVRVPKKTLGSRSSRTKKNMVTTKKTLGQVQVLKWKGRPRGGRKPGRPSIRGKHTTANKIVKVGGERTVPKVCVSNKSRGEGETARLQVEDVKNASNSGSSDFEEENDRASDEFDHVDGDFASGINGKSSDLFKDGDYNLNVKDDAVEEFDDGEGEDFNVARYMNVEFDEVGKRARD